MSVFATIKSANFILKVIEMRGNTDLQQDGGVEEAEHVQHDAARHQQGPTSQTGAPQRVQVTRHQAAHQACHPVQQLHPHDHLHR